MLAELLSLIESVPATFWGVVTGSFFALGGVMITNRSNDRRLRAHLAHDREIRNRERELSLRKDIYLAAAEAISAGLNAIPRFADMDVPYNQLMAGYIEKAASIAKVHVIAKEETVKTVTAFLGELTSVYLRLSPKRFILAQEKAKIDLLKQEIDTFGKERDRMVELMRQFNLEGSNDQHRWQVMQNNFDFEQKRIEDSAAQHDALGKALYGKLLRFMKECVHENARLNRLLVPVLSAVRSELELPLDENAYMQIVEESIRKQEARIDEFLQAAHQLAVQPLVAADALPAAPR